MRLSNQEAARRLAALKGLESVGEAFPAAAGFRIYQNTQALETALTPYWLARDGTIRKYSKNGKSIRAEDDPAAFEECMREIAELDAAEIEVEIHSFPLSMIRDKNLPLNILLSLGFMLSGEGD